MNRSADRIDQLARRVRWLDRYRRLLAIVATGVVTPVLIYNFEKIVGTDWPDAHVWMLGAMLALLTWWTSEVALAWVTALWETQHDRLARGRGLPIAYVVRR